MAQPGTSSSIQVVAALKFDDLHVGHNFSFTVVIESADIDRFADLSGDFSPLHMDDSFARGRGFQGRVVHGAYLSGLVSRLLGMHLPGRDCLLQSIQMQFIAPAYAERAVCLTGTVDQLSEAVSAAVIKVRIVDVSSGGLLARATANIGFTKERLQD